MADMHTPYPNLALTDICEQLLDQWVLTPDQIANLAKDIAGECECILERRQTKMETTNG